ncbi:MAG: type II toxin-antitoxin system VapC family toxin [Bryobacteraceae bacterium]
MSGYLLDTNVAIIALTDPDRLSAVIQSAILAGPNVLSVVSYWEVLLKSMKGNLMKVGDPRAWWLDALEQLAATPLALRPNHIAEIYTLPDIHKDPFDRALIAQASVEGLDIVTLDAGIPRYASARVRVLSRPTATRSTVRKSRSSSPDWPGHSELQPRR